MMTLRQFIKQAGDLVGQQKTQMALKLAKGQCPNMETYNREVGRMEGMDIAVNILREMRNQLEEAEEAQGQLPEMPPGPIGVPQTGAGND